MTKTFQATKLAGGLCYPECPRWHDGELWLSDQYDRTIVRIDMAGHVVVAARLDDSPSGLGWLGDDEVLVATMHEHQIRGIQPGGGSRVVAELAGKHRGPTNDMIVVPPDLIYVGNIGFDFYAGEELQETDLFKVEPSGSVSIAASGLICPNGMAISPDRSTLHVAESLAGRITSFDIAPDGALLNRRVFAELPGLRPDGICLDADGAIWAACARTTEAVRVAPGGEILAVAHSEGNAVYACALGGADRRSLFLCTSPSDIADEALELRDGRVETCVVDIAGVGWN